jgi:hypothetical protein
MRGIDTIVAADQRLRRPIIAGCAIAIHASDSGWQLPCPILKPRPMRCGNDLDPTGMLEQLCITREVLTKLAKQQAAAAGMGVYGTTGELAVREMTTPDFWSAVDEAHNLQK